MFRLSGIKNEKNLRNSIKTFFFKVRGEARRLGEVIYLARAYTEINLGWGKICTKFFFFWEGAKF